MFQTVTPIFLTLSTQACVFKVSYSGFILYPGYRDRTLDNILSDNSYMYYYLLGLLQIKWKVEDKFIYPCCLLPDLMFSLSKLNPLY